MEEDEILEEKLQEKDNKVGGKPKWMTYVVEFMDLWWTGSYKSAVWPWYEGQLF